MLKGLAIIYDPHNLYQFIWYYCSTECEKDKKWDALCLPNGYKGEYMHEYCERAGIFEEIYRNNTDFSKLEIMKKLRMVISMFFYFLMEKRKSYCKKLLNRFVDIDTYDEIVIIADVGIVSGACCALGDEKKVVILEDGISDYGDRPRFIRNADRKSFYKWQGLIMSFMGYCSPGWYYLKTDRQCIKYCSQPDLMEFREYKEIRQLFDAKVTEWDRFKVLTEKIYPEIKEIDFNGVDAMIFTRPIDDFVVNCDKYCNRISDYIKDNYKNVLLKRHPREKTGYRLDGIKALLVDNSIPAEVILPYIRGIDVITVTTTAVMISFPAYGINSKVIYLKGLWEESKAQNTMFKPMTIEELKLYCDKFTQGHYEIIQI